MEKLHGYHYKQCGYLSAKVCYVMLLLCFVRNGKSAITQQSSTMSTTQSSTMSTTQSSTMSTTQLSTMSTTQSSTHSSNFTTTDYVDDKGLSSIKRCQRNLSRVCCDWVYPQFVAVPSDIPQYTEYLDLNNNAIRKLGKDSFFELELLIEIYLQNNSISYIHQDSFRNMFKLEILNLQDNDLAILDPSGLTFQHLVSLRSLNLHNSNITKVNKFSFLTLGVSNNSVVIDLGENPIYCDCDVWTLKNWRPGRVEIILNCANDDQRRSYLDVEFSNFENCNLTQDGILSEVTECPKCSAESTNYKCNNQPRQICGPEMVCHQSFTWARGNMSINSTCESYDTCLNQEANNSEKCVVSSQENYFFDCNFCCKGPTCINNSIGGRTKDFIFYISFSKENIEPFIEEIALNWTKDNLETAPKSLQNNVGGIYIDIYSLWPGLNNSYTVVLQLHVTTLSNETEWSTQDVVYVEILTFLGGKIDRPAISSYFEGMECDTSNINCPKEMNCVETHDGLHRCLCNDSSFFKELSKSCSPLSELEVTNLNATSTNDTVTLTWSEKKYGARVSYTIQSLPNQGQGSASVNGGSWSGLTPGTQYNFSITSTLSTAFSVKNVSVTICEVWTKFAHGSECDDFTNMCLSGLNCIPSVSGEKRCLCDIYSFYVNPSKMCLPLNVLAVNNITVRLSTMGTVIFTWTAENYGANVSYRIQPSPNHGQAVMNSVGVNGGTWSGLDPEKKYNFTITSEIQGDQYYPQKIVTITVMGIGEETLTNATIILSYIRKDSSDHSLLNDSSNAEYRQEVQRIETGVKSVISKLLKIVYLNVTQLILLNNHQSRVVLELEVVISDKKPAEKVINDLIQASIENYTGFFFIENIQSLEVSSNNKDSENCPSSMTTSNKGVMLWTEVGQGGSQQLLCTYYDALADPLPKAYRNCTKNKMGVAVWSDVDDSSCATTDNIPDPNLDNIVNRNITPAVAMRVSSYLKNLTSDVKNFTAENMSKSVNLLEVLTSKALLAVPDIVNNVMYSVSNLLNVNAKTLAQSEASNSSSSRLLKVIDSIPNKVNILDAKLEIMTPNLAVAAQKLDAKETQDITVIANTESGSKKNNTLVNINFSNESILSPGNSSSIIIPTSALLDSLTTEDRNKVDRISFVVHRSDILFATIKSSEEPLTTTPPDILGESSGNYSVNQTNIPRIITKINSAVISASIPGVKVQNLTSKIIISFQHVLPNAKNAKCVFWDESLSNKTGAWSSEGCGIVESNERGTTCGCNHLTNFALLMDIYDEGIKLSDLDRQILSIISYVGCGISSLGLLFTLITYSLLRKLRRDNPSKILINLCLALLLSNLVFLIGMQDYTFNNIAACKAVAVLMHYFLLASLTWMAVEAFYMYLALVIIFNTYFTNFILKCVLVGWGVPLLVIVITLAVNATDNYGFINSGLCWLKNPAFYGAFVGPVCFILLLNILAFIMVIKQLVGMSSNKLNKSDKNSTIQRLRGAVGVVILLGLAWIFAIFAIGQASVVFYYLFAVFNSLQGLFIFIFYCLLKSDAVISLKRSLPCFDEYGDTSKSYINSRGVTAKAIDHHLAENKSGSANFSENTKSTASTSIDSRKDSCFSTLSSNLATDNAETNGLRKDVESDISVTAEQLLDQHSQNIKNGPPFYSLSDPENPSKHFSSSLQNIQETSNIINAHSDYRNNIQNDSNIITMYKNTHPDKVSTININHTQKSYKDTHSEHDMQISNYNTENSTDIEGKYGNTMLESTNITRDFNQMPSDQIEETTDNLSTESGKIIWNLDQMIQDDKIEDTIQLETKEMHIPSNTFDKSRTLITVHKGGNSTIDYQHLNKNSDNNEKTDDLFIHNSKPKEGSLGSNNTSSSFNTKQNSDVTDRDNNLESDSTLLFHNEKTNNSYHNVHSEHQNLTSIVNVMDHFNNDTNEENISESDNSIHYLTNSLKNHYSHKANSNATLIKQKSISFEQQAMKLNDSDHNLATSQGEPLISGHFSTTFSLPYSGSTHSVHTNIPNTKNNDSRHTDIQYTGNDLSLYMEAHTSARQDIASQPDMANLPEISTYTNVMESKANPSFTPFTAEGEIDYSNPGSVHDIKHKFEWSMSENSDKNVTKT